MIVLPPCLVNQSRKMIPGVAIWLAVLAFAVGLRADEPYSRTRDYDLQHSKIALRFDLDQRKVIGDVTHTVSILRDNTAKVSFDAVGLHIHRVTVISLPPSLRQRPQNLSFRCQRPHILARNSISKSSTRASRRRASTSFFPTKVIRVVRNKFGARGNQKIRATTCRPTTIPTIGSRPKRF